MLLNFFVDFLLLIGTNQLSGHYTSYKKVILASLLGSAYSAVCFVSEFQFLGGWHWRCIVLLAMGVVAFGWEENAIRRCCVFLILSMALAGVAVLFQNLHMYSLLLSAFLILILCSKAFGNSIIGNQYVKIEIPCEKGYVKLTALKDTGNQLCDILTGDPVLIVGHTVARKLTGLTREELQDPINTISKMKSYGMRLVPYRAIGVDNGLLLAKSYSNVKVDKHIRKAVVAFAPTGFDDMDSYNALIGG